MSKIYLSHKSTSPGCCRKCGKPLEWAPAYKADANNPHPCMATAEQHIRALQIGVARNTKYCSDCSAKLKDDLILNIVLFPFNVVKYIIKLFSR